MGAVESNATCGPRAFAVPGDHVFRFEAGDGTNTVSENLTVPVYPADTQGRNSLLKANG